MADGLSTIVVMTLFLTNESLFDATGGNLNDQGDGSGAMIAFQDVAGSSTVACPRFAIGPTQGLSLVNYPSDIDWYCSGLVIQD